MSGTTMNPGDKSAREIESEVERTRSNVSDTLDALRGKLAPGQMMDQAIDQIADYARGSGGAEFARNLGTSVRDNPLPVALIGAGIAWLLLSNNKSSGTAVRSTYDTGPRLLPPPETDAYVGSAQTDAYVGSMPVGRARTGGTRARVSDMVDNTTARAGEAAGAVGDAASRAASAVGDAASGAASAIGDAASEAAAATTDVFHRTASAAGDAASRAAAAGSDLAGGVADAANRAMHGIGSLTHRAAGAAGGGMDAASRQASMAARGVGQLGEAQPLLLGALGLALGAAIGAILPRTRAEDQLMGEARDSVAGRVGEVARETYENVRTAAEDGIEQVQEQLATSYSEAKEGLDKGGLSSAGEVLGKVATDVTHVAGEALRDVAGEAKRNVEEAGATPDAPRQG